jgi:hypothetical protein
MKSSRIQDPLRFKILPVPYPQPGVRSNTYPQKICALCAFYGYPNPHQSGSVSTAGWSLKFLARVPSASMTKMSDWPPRMEAYTIRPPSAE